MKFINIQASARDFALLLENLPHSHVLLCKCIFDGLSTYSHTLDASDWFVVGLLKVIASLRPLN